MSPFIALLFKIHYIQMWLKVKLVKNLFFFCLFVSSLTLDDP